ncbi:hypothetical protein PR202_gb04165 [Eleusine coracana subsp. coracana]|uniref:Uncharacterized protein n=1 Tax=Eleusine coracana subsp. coracana TaxID=191504 RepID=A0AAV5E336_ELECO|nr:hypothetical protein PR202_gb04165 [Eleusine coracana subsp. coracana]
MVPCCREMSTGHFVLCDAAECRDVSNWVERDGSLLLVCDLDPATRQPGTGRATRRGMAHALPTFPG